MQSETYELSLLYAMQQLDLSHTPILLESIWVFHNFHQNSIFPFIFYSSNFSTNLIFHYIWGGRKSDSLIKLKNKEHVFCEMGRQELKVPAVIPKEIA